MSIELSWNCQSVFDSQTVPWLVSPSHVTRILFSDWSLERPNHQNKQQAERKATRIKLSNNTNCSKSSKQEIGQSAIERWSERTKQWTGNEKISIINVVLPWQRYGGPGGCTNFWNKPCFTDFCFDMQNAGNSCQPTFQCCEGFCLLSNPFGADSGLFLTSYVSG